VSDTLKIEREKYTYYLKRTRTHLSIVLFPLFNVNEVQDFYGQAKWVMCESHTVRAVSARMRARGEDQRVTGNGEGEKRNEGSISMRTWQDAVSHLPSNPHHSHKVPLVISMSQDLEI
jgi:hypothetical protein